jgi:hypothetical protein
MMKQVLPVTTPVKRDVGEKDLTTAKGSPKQTALPNVIREDALVQIQENVVICSVQVGVQDLNKGIVSLVETSTMMESANKNVLP